MATERQGIQSSCGPGSRIFARSRSLVRDTRSPCPGRVQRALLRERNETRDPGATRRIRCSFGWDHPPADLCMEGLGMEPLPKGANFVRAKTLWEIGLHIAGNPATPYGGNRDMVITVGSGSGAAFRPSLRLATGSAILAEEVAKGGGVDLAFVNPSALLTQAYRRVGLFSTPLP